MRTLKANGCGMLAVVWVYLIFSFAYLSINPTVWHPEARLCFGLMGILGYAIASLIYLRETE